MERVLIVDPLGGDPGFLARYIRERGADPVTAVDGTSWQDVAHDCTALIVNLAKIDRGAMEKAPRCRVISRLGVGTDNVDLESARALGITVTNVPDYCTEEVADHALTLVLASLRKVVAAHADVQAGTWSQLGYRPIRRFNHLTLGLVGFGKLGRALAARARAIGFRVIAHDPFARPSRLVELVPLDTLFREADVVSLHAPSSPQTRHVVNEETLALCKESAIIVNTARGDLVDEHALAAALDGGRIAGAALDVFEQEPLPQTSPLRGRANVLCTPHMAFYSEQSLEDLQRQAVSDVLAVLAGLQPLNPVVQ